MSDLLAVVGVGQLHDMFVAPPDTIPEDVRDQARRTLEDNQDVLKQLMDGIDLVVEPDVRAASVASLGIYADEHNMFQGWREKLEFWT